MKNIRRALLVAFAVSLVASLLTGCSPGGTHPNDRPCQDFFDAVNQAYNDIEIYSGRPETEWRVQAEKNLAWMRRTQEGATGDVQKSVKEILSAYPKLVDSRRDEAALERFRTGINHLDEACIATGFNPSSGRRDG